MKTFLFFLALSALAAALPQQQRSSEAEEEPAAYKLDCGGPGTTDWCASRYNAGCNADGSLYTDNVFYCGSTVCKCD
ncbi:hypothetical protein F4811DRAFT_548655 [Daldinia bambusicola]|nr:hypothetical protein F4811DRAFT_548655 [Daldinia bambusicola]